MSPPPVRRMKLLAALVDGPKTLGQIKADTGLSPDSLYQAAYLERNRGNLTYGPLIGHTRKGGYRTWTLTQAGREIVG